jgi:hypothetical protein
MKSELGSEAITRKRRTMWVNANYGVAEVGRTSRIGCSILPTGYSVGVGIYGNVKYIIYIV